MNKLKLATLAGLLLFCMSLYAQNEALKGVVVEKDDHGNIAPIMGAVVYWMHTNTGTTTDSNGVFHIPFSKETKRLIVGYVGYKTDTVFIADPKNVRIVLISKSRLKEVDIVVQRKGTEISYMDPWKTTIMNEKELFKQACCNLAESFETNPSVDVAFSDAVTGTKQIQMLGLASQYSQVTQEYMPSVRGLATQYGFTYTPGTWLNSIQVTKGIGSVVNGFESISGVINTELHKSDVKDKVYLNVYASEGGRYEANLNLAGKVSSTFSHALLTHYSTYTLQTDFNKDGYLDNPLGYQVNLLYRWKWDITKNVMFQGGVRVLRDEKEGGQMHHLPSVDSTASAPSYSTQVRSYRNEGWLKLGYIFPKKVYKSLGLQVSASDQLYHARFGYNTWYGSQQSVYANLIYQSIIGSSDHKFRTGLSNQSDWYDEDLTNKANYSFTRNEVVTGAFFEYTFAPVQTFTLVGGVRADYNNLYGMFYTPRLHLRWVPAKKTVVRLSAGTGQRTANILAENTGLLVSNRQFVFNGNPAWKAYGFKPERAFNAGFNVVHDFKFNYRPGVFTVDFYYTDFINQVVVDRDEDIHKVSFYTLSGKSRSASMQLQLDYEPVRRLDVRLAYRYYDVFTTYRTGVVRQVPLVAKQRGFVNVAYQTKSKWSFDVTVQLNGPKRLPVTVTNPGDKQMPEYSAYFTLVNTQVTKSFTRLRMDVYAGVENVFDFKQSNPIIDGTNPYGQYFDASMVWGPVFGRMIYGGLRYRL